MNTPLAMLVAGATLSGTSLKELFSRPRILYISALRLLLFPAITALLAAGLVTGLAGIGGGIAVAAGAPAAIAATSEDPKSFGKSIIFVALGESIALYGVVIAILILQKV